MEGGFGRLSFFPFDHRTRRQRKGPRRRTGRASCPLPVHPRSGDFLGLPEPVPQDPGFEADRTYHRRRASLPVRRLLRGVTSKEPAPAP
jgi:hypothetical protein